MATLQELQAGLVDVDAKLDLIVALIASMQPGQLVTQEQLDALNASVAAIKAKEDGILTPQP